jgi:proteic killer suppression protein
MIISFKGELADDVFYDRYNKNTRKFPIELRKVAQRKLQYLNSAYRLLDLQSPPGNRLEKLKGSFKDYYSIRINDQWRIVFKWECGAYDVQIIDYH